MKRALEQAHLIPQNGTSVGGNNGWADADYGTFSQGTVHMLISL